MIKYDKLYVAVRTNRRKSDPTFNQELLEMFLLLSLRRKKGAGDKLDFTVLSHELLLPVSCSHLCQTPYFSTVQPSSQKQIE